MNRELTVGFPGGFRIDVDIDGKIVHTDQPADQGGDGEAPDPMELFLASLAACAGFYVLNFCRTRHLDMNGVSVRVQTTYDASVKRHTHLQIRVGLPDGFPAKYVEPVRRAVDTCSVKKHLVNPPEIETRVAIE